MNGVSSPSTVTTTSAVSSPRTEEQGDDGDDLRIIRDVCLDGVHTNRGGLRLRSGGRGDTAPSFRHRFTFIECHLTLSDTQKIICTVI